MEIAVYYLVNSDFFLFWSNQIALSDTNVKL